MLKTGADPRGPVLRSLQIITLHVDNADSDIGVPGDLADDVQLRKFAAGHLQVNLVHSQIEKSGEHGGITARPHRPAFEIPETKVSRKAALADDGFDRAVENINQLLRILSM